MKGTRYQTCFRKTKQCRNRLIFKVPDLMCDFVRGSVFLLPSVHLFYPEDRINYRCHGSQYFSTGWNAFRPKALLIACEIAACAEILSQYYFRTVRASGAG